METARFFDSRSDDSVNSRAVIWFSRYHDFTAEQPNRLSPADITDYTTCAGSRFGA